MSELERYQRGEVGLPKSNREKRTLGLHYSRPYLQHGQLWCAVCQKPAANNFNFCAHSAGDPGKSRFYIGVECHGESAEIIFRFWEWHQYGFEEGKRVVVFDNGATLPEPPAPAPMVIQSRQLMLMDRQPESSIESKVEL